MEDSSRKAIRQLINEVCFGRTLSDHEKDFLRYMDKHAGDAHFLSEHGIAKEFLRWEDWDKRRSNVRTLVARVRSGLKTFFDDPRGGRASRQRLEIPERPPYRLEMAVNLQHDAVARFWGAHFANGERNMVLYTEPVFFYDPLKRCFVRFLDVNSDDLDQIHESLDPRLRGLTACFHYQPTGEARAVKNVTRWFEGQEYAVEVKPTRECTNNEGWGCNLVLLGNSRTNRFMRQLQSPAGLEVIVEDYRVKDTRTCTVYEDLDEVTGANFAYALVTRSPSKFSQFCVTAISANHGRAAQKASEFLTSEIRLRQFFQRLSINREEELPKSFQILFKVETHDFDVAEGDAQPILCRGLETESAASG